MLLCAPSQPRNPLLLPMDPYHSLDPSLFHEHDGPTPQDDIHREYPALQVMQNHHSTSPCVETRSPVLFAQPYRAKLSIQTSLPRGHTEIGEYPNQIHRSFSIDSQSDGSNDTFNVSSPSRSASLSPSQMYNLGTSVPGKLQFLSVSQH